MDTLRVIQVVGAGCAFGGGALYCASSQGAVSAVTFLATAILLYVPLDRFVVLPMAKWSFSLINGPVGFFQLQVAGYLSQNDPNDAKLGADTQQFMDKVTPYVCFAQCFFMLSASILSFSANPLLTLFAETAITFTAKQIASSGILAALNPRVILASCPPLTVYRKVVLGVVAVNMIFLLYISRKD